MKYIVLRFTRNKTNEQWVIPVPELTGFLDTTTFNELILPVSVSDKHGQMANVLFTREHQATLQEVTHPHSGVYYVFTPPISISDHLLQRLVTQHLQNSAAWRVSAPPAADNLYRL